MSTTQSSIVYSEFQDAIQALQTLTNQHERAYRLGVGEYILQRFFGGQAAAFSSRDAHKEAKFTTFLTSHAAELAELDLADHTLRRCVRTRICFDTLPLGIRDKLSWSALLAIAGIDEPNIRARVAAATVREKWPVTKVKEAAALAAQNRLWDTDPEEPGLQMPEPKAATPPQPGRLVTQTEKWGEQIGSWRQEFERIDASKLTKAQLERMHLAVAAARGQLDELEAKLKR